MRVERDGNVMRRDLANIRSPFNKDIETLPQAIFRDTEELRRIAAAVEESGYKCLDLNLGCPFTPQVRKGRGAGMIANPGELEQVAKFVMSKPEISFSVKMRLGLKKPDEWSEIAGILNSMPLHHVCVHPRTAMQQYRGEINLDEFDAICDTMRHPVVFNGDVLTTEDFKSITNRFPNLSGVMLGRGLLKRPSLAAEIRGTEWNDGEVISGLMKMHEMVFSHYSKVLCGQAQILAKMKAFWEYPSALLGRKTAKAILKSGNLISYNQALASIETY